MSNGISFRRPAEYYPRDKNNLYECVRWKLEYLRRKVYRVPMMFDYPYKTYIGMNEDRSPWVRYVLDHVYIGGGETKAGHTCKRVPLPYDEETGGWWNYSGMFHCRTCKLMGNFNTFNEYNCLEIK